ncbi:hypothetical protein MPSEU_000582600 [Mayamaea pseudoterrestris]|nr:hypothetical protein MPSEU_000582600 [Mayamaea pseudoterrestris]
MSESASEEKRDRETSRNDASSRQNLSNETLPKWVYQASERRQENGEDIITMPPPLTGDCTPDLGTYVRKNVTNLDSDSTARAYFDLGLRLMFAYQHELAANCFMATVQLAPFCALAHGLIALCHGPNYNFKGEPYYESSFRPNEAGADDASCIFPSQHVASRHSKAAMQVIDSSRDTHQRQPDESGAVRPNMISESEMQWLQAIHILTSQPGVDPLQATQVVGHGYANAMRLVHQAYPDDADIAFYFAEALMVLNAWRLYEYPSGEPLSPDVDEIRNVLENMLARSEHAHHAGLCHLYVHLMEMSAQPELAFLASASLRHEFPDAGHLVHMGTHIDVLVGDYEACVKFNQAAVIADEHVATFSPQTNGPQSFYFNYAVHNYHMLVFGAILGGMEQQGMIAARKLNETVNESFFEKHPNLVAYLESYSALDVHIMIRFGRWKEILELELPKNELLMLYRAGSMHSARGLALATMERTEEALEEAKQLDALRQLPEASARILYNNSVDRLLDVEAAMLRGEIAYRVGDYELAFSLLRDAVKLQDGLNYDEPWGKMQPIRHALGGLLLEQGQVDEAAEVFRLDLKLHPKNPFAMVGLIACLKRMERECCGRKGSGGTSSNSMGSVTLSELESLLKEQRGLHWADFDIRVACECCKRS